jgi:hypothetical protein
VFLVDYEVTKFSLEQLLVTFPSLHFLPPFLALLLPSLTLLFYACHSSEEDQGAASLQGSAVLSGAGAGAEGDTGMGSALGYVRYT